MQLSHSSCIVNNHNFQKRNIYQVGMTDSTTMFMMYDKGAGNYTIGISTHRVYFGKIRGIILVNPPPASAVPREEIRGV